MSKARKNKKTEPLRVLIAHHRWWFPTSMSGADYANHEFAYKLRARGVEVQVQGILPPDRSRRVRTREYDAAGVPVCLTSTDFTKRLMETVKAFEPHVVLTSCPEPSCGADDITRMVDTFRRRDLPVVLYVHDIGGTLPLFEQCKDRLSAVVTNSRFMAAKIEQRWSTTCEVVYPVPDPDAVYAGTSVGPFITFFNPAPHKGLGVAHALVTKHFPDRPFLFVEGFIDPEAHGIALVRSGNLVHARRSPDVATIYMMTRLAIVPSQWEEPFGRVALEAMYNRIPVLASRVGGLPESVGDGGILIDDYSNVEPWVEAIEALDDVSHRRQWIRAGTRHARRFSLDDEVDKLVGILSRAAGR